jgi:hypothetical protein
MGSNLKRPIYATRLYRSSILFIEMYRGTRALRTALSRTTFFPHKLELMPLHIHARPPKPYAFHAQPEPLLGAVFAWQLDRASRAHHALPWQSRNLTQYAHHLPRRARPSCRASNRAIARNRSRWQATNQAHNAHAPVRCHLVFTLRSGGSSPFYCRFSTRCHRLSPLPLHVNLGVAHRRLDRI